MGTDHIAERVAQSVSQALITAGKSKKWAAEAAGIPYTTLGRKLLGTTEFTYSELFAIAKALGVSPSRFVPSEFLGRGAA